jgi:hypothetical protein
MSQDPSPFRVVPFVSGSRELGMYDMKSGQCTATVTVSGKARVTTGAGRGKRVAVIVFEIVGWGKMEYYLDIYDSQLSRLQQRITVKFAEADEVRMVDISGCDTRVAVLTFKGRDSVQTS